MLVRSSLHREVALLIGLMGTARTGREVFSTGTFSNLKYYLFEEMSFLFL